MNSTDAPLCLPAGSPSQKGEVLFCIAVSRSAGEDDVKVSAEYYMAPGWMPKEMLKQMLHSLETHSVMPLN